MNYLLPERLDRLAREYAIGTLHGGARRRFERLMRASPLAMQAALAWQERLTTLAAAAPPLMPAASVWSSLEQRLFSRPAAQAAAPRAGGWLGGWLSARTLGGVLVGALVCGVVLKQQPALLGHEAYRDALPASYVGLLTDGAGKATLLASSRRHGRSLTIKMLQPLAIPAGTVAQLWALPRDGAPAFPVGTLPAQGAATIALGDSSEKLFANVARLAVSIEAAAARPGAKPTGEFILSGHCVKLW